MAPVRTLERLLRVLTIEEEQEQAALESALSVLRYWESYLKAALERERRGRRLVVASASTGDGIDRAAALAETNAGSRMAAAMTTRVAKAQQNVAVQRERFLAKRLERRQAETLLRDVKARESVEQQRRVQRSADDWYLGQLWRNRPREERD